MDKTLLRDLEASIRALRAAIVKTQNGVAALTSLAKVSEAAMRLGAPSIISELHQLETEMQKVLRSYRDFLHKASSSLPADEGPAPRQ
jgi:hypothetical protein